MTDYQKETGFKTTASYYPLYVHKNRHNGYTLIDERTDVGLKRRIEVDALFHYFVDEDTECCDAADDREITQGDIIAQLIARKYHANPEIINEVFEHEAPSWTQFRDEATFISGDIVDGAVDDIAGWLHFHHGENMVELDASKYANDSEKGTPQPAFDKLMSLANNINSVIEEGVIKLYPEDTRSAFQFLNAAQHDVLEDNPYSDTKWLAEGRILAQELVNIPEFLKNFNLLVIKGAARYIHSNQLNLNALYRLFAKLGRVNTRFVFLG